MKFFIALFALIALVSGKPSSHVFSSIEVSVCNDITADYISGFDLSIQPDPILVADGAEIAVTFNMELIKEVGVGSTIRLHIVKKGIFDLPVPCLPFPDLNLPIGSCTYAGDDLLAEAENGGLGICPTYFPPGQACKLPLGLGHYGGDTPLVITLPDIPDIITLLGAGTYEVTTHIADANGNETGCIMVKAEIVNHT